MRLKLDENLDARLVQPLRQAGQDVTTVPEQGLRGAADTALSSNGGRSSLCRLETGRGARRGFFLPVGAEAQAHAGPGYQFLIEVLNQVDRLDEVKWEAIAS